MRQILIALLLPHFSAGGSCDTANMSSLILNPEKREIVLELFDYKDDIERNKLDDILTRLNVCLTIINSDNFIDIDNFEKYCKHTQIKLRLFAPWMELSTTLHMFLGSFH